MEVLKEPDADASIIAPIPSSGMEDDENLGSQVIRSENYDTVKVDLAGGRDYPIYIGTGYADEEAAQMLRSHVQGSKVLIVTNDKVGPLYLKRYQDLLASAGDLQVLETIVLPDGEVHKDMETMQLVLNKCLEIGLDRKSTIVALGGGVIGDMAGFAASIYQRGIEFIQIPTTVMSMVDSSVGGKTGVNHPMGKNMIGAFHQPSCVFIDTAILDTLPDRELCSGISEIIKYGLIRDSDLFEWLENEGTMEALVGRNAQAMRYAVTRSCQNKAAVVKQDEREGGIRATLNLGHTFGHAIENGEGYGVYLHGEAVSIGTVMAARMSAKMQWIDDSLEERAVNLLKRAQQPVVLPPDSPMTRDTFLRLMSLDKKVQDGKWNLILLKGRLGDCVFTSDFDQQALIDTIDEFIHE